MVLGKFKVKIMKIGFIIPTYSGEKRVAILPEHIKRVKNTFYIEDGFGDHLEIKNSDYEDEGCVIMSRKDIFATCDIIFCLKLLQPEDYEFLRKDQIIIGWTHPTGSGKLFYDTVAIPKKIKVFDLDNIYPKLFYLNKSIGIPFIPRDFIWKNSFNAGVASVSQALLEMGIYPSSNTKVAVLANGSVSQGAYSYLSKFNVNMRMFYRKTMHEFIINISEYDIIVNGIEVDNSVDHIINKDDLTRVKKGCLIIDSAADAGNAIEGTRYTTILKPIYEEEGIFYYEVNNAPSVLYRQSSFDISDSLTSYIFNEDVERFVKIAKDI